MIRKLVKGLELDFSREQHTLGVPDTLSQKRTKTVLKRNQSRDIYVTDQRNALLQVVERD